MNSSRPTAPVSFDPRAAWRVAAERNALHRATVAARREAQRLADLAQGADEASERPTVRPSAA